MIIRNQLINTNKSSIKSTIFVFMMGLIFTSDALSTSIALDTLPAVFMLGDKEVEYEKLVEDCSVPLFSISDDSMDKAYKSWLGMLHEIELFAEADTYDIKGVKLWINVFWNGDGTIKHITYFPKPNSKNIDFDKMGVLLEKFIRQYKFKEDHESCFSHYGSATFPTHAQYYLNKN